MPASIPATVFPGHRVASGLNGNPLFPGGTLRMQLPFFRELGLDLSPFYLGTLNVSIAPFRYRVISPRHTFRGVKWHPTEPAEDFSFLDVLVHLGAGAGGEQRKEAGAPNDRGGHGSQADGRTRLAPVRGLIYHPHPDTKPAHFQRPDVLELLLPWTEGLAYGATVFLEAPLEQIVFEPCP